MIRDPDREGFRRISWVSACVFAGRLKVARRDSRRDREEIEV